MKIAFFVSQSGSWDGSDYWFPHLNLIDFFDVVGQQPGIERVDLCLPIRHGREPGNRWTPAAAHLVRMPFWRSEADLLRRLPVVVPPFIKASLPSIRSADVVGATLPGLTGSLFLTIGQAYAKKTFAIIRGVPRRTLQRSGTHRLERVLFPALMRSMELYGALLVRRGAECIPIASGLERQLKAPPSTVVTPVLAPAFRLRAARTLFTDDRVRLLYVGRLSGEKNLDLLVASLKLLQDDPSWTLTIAGSGPEERPLRALVARVRLDARVTFLGSVEHGECLRDVYLGHDVFVLPSSTEGAPQALAEAMGMGLCPLVSNVGGMPEMIGDLASDSLFGALRPTEVASTLRTVCREWRPYTERSRRAWELSERLTFPVGAEQLLRVLNGIRTLPEGAQG